MKILHLRNPRCCCQAGFRLSYESGLDIASADCRPTIFGAWGVAVVRHVKLFEPSIARQVSVSDTPPTPKHQLVQERQSTQPGVGYNPVHFCQHVQHQPLSQGTSQDIEHANLLSTAQDFTCKYQSRVITTGDITCQDQSH